MLAGRGHLDSHGERQHLHSHIPSFSGRFPTHRICLAQNMGATVKRQESHILREMLCPMEFWIQPNIWELVASAFPHHDGFQVLWHVNYLDFTKLGWSSIEYHQLANNASGQWPVWVLWQCFPYKSSPASKGFFLKLITWMKCKVFMPEHSAALLLRQSNARKIRT